MILQKPSFKEEFPSLSADSQKKCIPSSADSSLTMKNSMKTHENCQRYENSELHPYLQEWFDICNEHLKRQINLSLLKKMLQIFLRTEKVSKDKIGFLLKDRSFMSELSLLSENGEPEFMLLAKMFGINDFEKNFQEITFFGTDLKSFEFEFLFN